MAQAVVIGGGLAGSEAAYQLARRGVAVTLYEMRPQARTPFHETDRLAELVCSNSLKSEDPLRAPGMLKAELKRLGSLLLQVAEETRVPAGAALAVDRQRFSAAVQQRLEELAEVNIVREPVETLAGFLPHPAEPVIVATGPATHPPLFTELKKLLGSDALHFYDATAPIVAGDSLDLTKLFFASRYGKGAGHDYLNAPMTREDYLRFRRALLQAELTPLHEGDTFVPFEGCLPVEELARRSEGAMRFGPLRPVGLRRGGEKVPALYAAVQLRREDALEQAWGMVGFQTRLTRPAQKEVFRLIPGLENARFLRYGRMHRNNYLRAPRHLLPTLQWQKHPHVLFAGQLTGLEGYVAAIATGLVAGLNAALLARGKSPLVFPRETALGALLHFLAHADAETYAPTAFTLAMLPPVTGAHGRNSRSQAYAARAVEAWDGFARAHHKELG